MGAWRVIATFYDQMASAYVRPGEEVPRRLLAAPSELARLEAAGCIVPLPAGDTPALPEPTAHATAGRRRGGKGR